MGTKVLVGWGLLGRLCLAGPLAAETAGLHRRAVIEPPERVTAVAPLRDGSLWLVGAVEESYRFARYGADGRRLGEFTVDPDGMMTYASRFLAVSPDETQLYCGDVRTKQVLLIDLAAGKLATTLDCPSGPLRFAQVDQGGAVVVGEEGVFTVDLAGPKLSAQVPAADAVAATEGGRVLWLQFPDNPHRALLEVSAGGDGERQRVDLGPVSPAFRSGALALSPDGKRLYVLLTGQRLLVLDSATLKPTAVLGLPVEPAINNLRLSPDGKLLALWAPRIGTILAAPTDPNVPISRYVHVSGAVTVLDTATLARVPLEEAGIDAPQNLCFSPDSRRLYVPDQKRRVVVFGR